MSSPASILSPVLSGAVELGDGVGSEDGTSVGLVLGSCVGI